MKAIEPVAGGFVERDGVRVHWQEFGAGEPTIVLLPTWSIVHSGHWKFQVPYLSRHHRVLTFDGRGCGLSDRPVGAEAYTHLEFAADTVAVLDATATEQAVLVGFSCGALWGVQVAADHPTGCSASWSSAQRSRSRHWTPRATCTRSTSRSRPRKGGPSTTATTGTATTRASSSSSSAGCSPRPTRRRRSTTAWAGGSNGRPDPRRRAPRPRCLRQGEHTVGVRAGSAAVARHPR